MRTQRSFVMHLCVVLFWVGFEVFFVCIVCGQVVMSGVSVPANFTQVWSIGGWVIPFSSVHRAVVVVAVVSCQLQPPPLHFAFTDPSRLLCGLLTRL